MGIFQRLVSVPVFFTLVFSSVFLGGCFKQAELGSKDNPIKLYFTPSVDSNTITTNSQDFLKFLEKETGYYFEAGIPASYVAVVEAFGSQRADIGVINSFSYLLANEKYGAEAKLKVIRHGLDHYEGQIIVRSDSGISKVEDLNGKKFAYTDPSSTSGYMFAKKLMMDHNVTPGEHVFAGKHDSVVTMVYQGQVDAGATFYSPPYPDGTLGDARGRVVAQFPDVADKVKILEKTEKIPNDPFVFRKGFPEKMTKDFISAVKKYIQTDKGKEVFKNIYSFEGIVETTDAEYDGFRKMVKTININPAELVK